MWLHRLSLLFLLLTPSAEVWGQDYVPWGDHPRLLLNARRLRLLQRERERAAPRWTHFELLIRGKARMPEQGFASALYARIATDQAEGRRAIQWALANPGDLRQLALVYDWCHHWMRPDERQTLARLLERGLAGQADTVERARSQAFAALALGEDSKMAGARLKALIETWWRGGLAPELEEGPRFLSPHEVFALTELLHAIRDSLQMDLTQDAPKFFKELAHARMMGYYPAPYPAAENEYRIPAPVTGKEPDLATACLSRAADFALVAYDPNALESQYLQTWLMNDRLMMRSPLGAPYELLWANPYLPGVSYQHLPLIYHHGRAGRLYVRSSWGEDATWLGVFGGQLQIFEQGQIRAPKPQELKRGIRLAEARVLAAAPPVQLSADGAETLFLVGLRPSLRFNLEIDDQEMDELWSDQGGILKVCIPYATRLRITPGDGLMSGPVRPAEPKSDP